MTDETPRAADRPVPLVKGTADLLPDDFAPLLALESTLMDRFARAGYRPIRVPVLEHRELHERKSGARVVADLYAVSEGAVCLRPEVTAGIVRAYNDAFSPPPLPWRVSYSGPVFRVLPTGPGVLREFHQVGVERLDHQGEGGDGEAIALANWSLSEAGIDDATVRIGHAGLIRDLLKWSGLPRGVQVALVEVLGDAAQGRGGSTPEDRILSAMEAHLEALADWLGSDPKAGETPVPVGDGGADRLFRTLYPEVVGRRSGREIIGRMRRKWDLGHGLAGVLGEVRGRVRELADLRGPAVDVLARLRRFGDVVPAMVRELTRLVDALKDRGVDPARIELDLGFGRGLGFYSQTVFVLLVNTPDGPVEVCGGGRYDGLARALGSAQDVGGVGFAFGLERLRKALDDRGQPAADRKRDETLIVANGLDAHAIAGRLRASGRIAVVESGDLPDLADSARLRGFARVVNRDGAGFLIRDLTTGEVYPVATSDELFHALSGDRS